MSIKFLKPNQKVFPLPFLNQIHKARIYQKFILKNWTGKSQKGATEQVILFLIDLVPHLVSVQLLTFYMLQDLRQQHSVLIASLEPESGIERTKTSYLKDETFTSRSPVQIQPPTART